MKWTEKQQQVIDSRNRNLLVSAAAGSGKTAVLVERIISMISEGTHPLNIDQLLVMTFTNAAASEMRERIGAAFTTKTESLHRFSKFFHISLSCHFFLSEKLQKNAN